LPVMVLKSVSTIASWRSGASGFVHNNDLSPVRGNLGKMKALAQVDEVKDVLWKHEPPKPTDARQGTIGPTRESHPTAWRDLAMFAPVASQVPRAR